MHESCIVGLYIVNQHNSLKKQHSSHFFFLKFILTHNTSKSPSNSIPFKSLEGMSCHWLSSSINLYRQVQFQNYGKYQKLHHFINRIQDQTSEITVQYLFYRVFLKYQSKSSTANFQIILKNITFLKAANSDSIHKDLRNQPAIFQSMIYVRTQIMAY